MPFFGFNKIWCLFIHTSSNGYVTVMPFFFIFMLHRMTPDTTSYTPIKDSVLLDGIRSGDDQILKQIFRVYKPPIIKLLIRDGAQVTEAEDIFMTGLEAIHQKLQIDNLILDKATFKTYFTRICLYQWSKVRRRKKFSSSVTMDHLEVLADVEDPEDAFLEIDRMNMMQNKLMTMSTECRQILEWYFSGEKSIQDMARILEISEGNVRKKKFDCKERLFKLMQNDPLYKELI